MASHFRIGKTALMTAQAVSSTTTYTSSTFHTLNLDNVAIQINYTGTPTGTFVIQVSTDHQVDPATQSVIVEGNWITVPVGTLSASGTADTLFIDINQISAPWMRVQYTNASSTGTVNVFASGKGLM